MRGFYKKLAAALLAALLLCSCAPAVRAESAVTKLTNIVYFVRFKGDDTNWFNTANTYNAAKTNWDGLRAAYEGNADPSFGNIDDSFRAYISAISFGALEVTDCFPQESADRHTIGIFTLSGAPGDYGDDYDVLRELQAAVKAGTLALPSGVTPDNRQKGVLDNVTVIFQLSEQQTEGIFYPHKAEAPDFKLGSYTVGTYNFLDLGSIRSDGQGVISHEYLHTLGFPDLYRNSGGIPVGRWDLMASVSRYQPFPLTWLRHQAGWLDIDTVDGAAQSGKTVHLTLNAATAQSGDRAFILRTPLSDSEFFVAEYRKCTDASASAGKGFDTKLPASGLLLYRVDNSVENHTNIAGGNYIYVFRTNPSSLAQDETPPLDNAVLTPWANETSYGSADMEAAYTGGTLYYADGSNSGIVIQNLTGTESGSAISFDVVFPDYGAMALWAKSGASQGSGNDAAPSCAFGTDGTPYLAWTSGEYPNQRIFVSRLQDGVWTALGGAVGSGSGAQLLLSGGVPYVLYEDGGYSDAVLKKYENGAWTQLADVPSVQLPCLTADAEGGWCACVSGVDAKTLTLYRLTAAGLTAKSSVQAAGMVSHPSLCVLSDQPALCWEDFSNSPDREHLAVLQNGALQEDASLPAIPGGQGALAADGDTLYLLSVTNSAAPVLYQKKAGVWTSEQVAAKAAYTGAGLTASGGQLWISLLNSTESKVRVLTKTGGVWTPYRGVAARSAGAVGSPVCRSGRLWLPASASTEAGGAAALYWAALPAVETAVSIVSADRQGASVACSLAEGSGTLLAAFYRDGRLLSASSFPVSAGGALRETLQVPSDADRLRLFLVNDRSAPLCPAAEKTLVP